MGYNRRGLIGRRPITARWTIGCGIVSSTLFLLSGQNIGQQQSFDDEGGPCESSNLEAGCEGSWLGRWTRPGGGEDLVRSQQEPQHQE